MNDQDMQCEEGDQDSWGEYVAYEEELQRQKDMDRTKMMGVLTPVFTWDENDDDVEVTNINPGKEWAV